MFFVSGSNASSSGAVTSSYDVIESRDSTEGKDGIVGQLTFVAGIPSYLACVAVGGYPPPQVRVHLGQVSRLIAYRVTQYKRGHHLIANILKTSAILYAEHSH